MAALTHTFSGPMVSGVDFSEESRRALVLAAAIAHRLAVTLHVATAIDPLLNEAATARYGAGHFVEDARNDLQAVVNEELGAPGATAVVEALVGEPAAVLLDVAARVDAAMIVVGTQGLGRAHRLIFGSTTLRLMRTTSRPVLAVPPGMKDVPVRAGTLWFDQIVCGVDFSEMSEVAARAAVALGRRLSVPTTLVHAAGRTAVPQAWKLFAESASDQQMHDADTRLRELALGLGEAAPAFEVVPGDPADVLEERGTSALIVLGLGGASNQRPGSTAIRVLTTTRRAVLTVPMTAASG